MSCICCSILLKSIPVTVFSFGRAHWRRGSGKA
jgi:hypothetical protein